MVINKFILYQVLAGQSVTRCAVLQTLSVCVACYPHMPIAKVWIYHLLFVCNFVCVFVWLWISPPKIKLAASNFARRFIGVQGRKSPILGNFAPWKAGSPKSAGESACARTQLQIELEGA